MKNYLISLLITIIVLLTGIKVKAKSFDVSLGKDCSFVIVNSKSGPWDPVINKSRFYGFKQKRRFKSEFEQITPTTLKVKPGDSLTIEYIDGYVCSDILGHPDRKTDANGYPKTLNTHTRPLPSFYISEQINHMALMGSFADSKGVIVDVPFFIGYGPTNIIVPEEARQLQLGINDNFFKDNAGLFIVKVSVDKYTDK